MQRRSLCEVSIEDANAELTAAREALRDASVLMNGDGSEAGICNRLYDAAVHAAQAALSVRGINPTSHGDGRRQFGQHVVLDGHASREQCRLLGVLYDHRQEAEYRTSPREWRGVRPPSARHRLHPGDPPRAGFYP